MTVASPSGSYLERPSGGLAEIVGLILDKGLVIDVYARVSLVGIEVLTIDARVVVASVDTYLRFAEAVNRLDLTQTETPGVPGLIKEVREGGAESKTKGALEGVKDVVGNILAGGIGEGDEEDEEDEEELEPEARPRQRSHPASRKDRER
jgi:gas vesicle structural protein